MKPLPERQNVDAALAVWANAERDQMGVVVDDNGNLELLYKSVRQLAPEVSATLTRDAMKQLVGKIQTEIQLFNAATGADNTKWLMTKLPSLGRFAAGGKLGNLRSEWQQLTRDRTAVMERIASERKGIFNKFRDSMPTMPMHTEADGTVVYRHNFDSPASQEQLREQLADIDNYQVKSGELSAQFQQDLPRSFLRVDAENGSQRFGLGASEQKLATLKKVFDNDEIVLATVSKVLNQVMPTMVLRPNAAIFPNPSMAVLQSDQQNAECSFFQIKRRGEIVELSVDVYGKIDKVDLPGDLENPNGRSWRMNQGAKWSGDPGPHNYGRHTHVSFTLNLAAARKGELCPLEGTKLNGLHQIRLCPVVRNTP